MRQTKLGIGVDQLFEFEQGVIDPVLADLFQGIDQLLFIAVIQSVHGGMIDDHVTALRQGLTALNTQA